MQCVDFRALFVSIKLGAMSFFFDKWLDHVVVRAYSRGTNDKSFDRWDIFASGKIV